MRQTRPGVSELRLRKYALSTGGLSSLEPYCLFGLEMALPQDLTCKPYEKYDHTHRLQDVDGLTIVFRLDYGRTVQRSSI